MTRSLVISFREPSRNIASRIRRKSLSCSRVMLRRSTEPLPSKDLCIPSLPVRRSSSLPTHLMHQCSPLCLMTKYLTYSESRSKVQQIVRSEVPMKYTRLVFFLFLLPFLFASTARAQCTGSACTEVVNNGPDSNKKIIAVMGGGSSVP